MSQKESTKASSSTTIATLGTPLNLTTQEIRIELLIPSDEVTKALFSLEQQRHGYDTPTFFDVQQANLWS